MKKKIFPFIRSVPKLRRGHVKGLTGLRLDITLAPLILILGFVLSGCTGHSQACKAASQKQPLQTPEPHLSSGSYASFDQTNFPFRKWLPLDGSKPSTVIVGLHGISGAAQDFQNLGKHLQNSMERVAVYAPELRGQGNDPITSRHGDIQSREHWLDDLRIFTRLVRQQHPQADIVWCGESMGALIALHGLASFPDKEPSCDALILASPIVGIHREVPSWKRHILRLASGLFPRITVSLEALAGNDEVLVTKDSIHQEQASTNPYHIPAFTLRLLNTLGIMIESSPQYAKKINQPVLILHGGHDIFSQSDAIEAFSRQFLQPDRVKRNFYPESYHLLFYGHEREQVLSDISLWIESLTLP